MKTQTLMYRTRQTTYE